MFDFLRKRPQQFTSPSGQTASQERANRLLAQAGAAMQAQQWAQAAECYREVLGSFPRVSPAWNNLGIALNRLQRLDEAKAAFEQAAGMDPNNADAHANLGILLARDMNRPQEAKPHLLKALAINPRHGCSLYLESLRATEHGEEEVAFRRPVGGGQPLAKDAVLQPDKQAQADRLEAQGLYPAALTIYQDFLKVHPDSLQALNNAATLHLKMRAPSRALPLLEKAIHLDPRYVKASNNLGTVRVMMKDASGAKAAFENTLKHDPTNRVARLNLDMLLKRGV